MTEVFILQSEDSKEKKSKIPDNTGKVKTIVRVTYETLIENPYKYTEKELIYEVHAVRRGKKGLKLESYNIKRNELFKRFGWGMHRNEQGKLALYGCESQEYERLSKTLKTTRAYRVSK